MSVPSEPGAAAAGPPHVYGVGDLLAGLRGLLEERVGRVWVAGEISNLHRAGSGHVYFTLKDERGQVRAALFRSAARRLAFEPENGLEVIVYADVTVYEARGDLQLVVRELEPRGAGALQLAFEQLRRRLEAEGLFDAARKRALPRLPALVGVVASPTSAALRDVLQIAARRFPAARILIAGTRVQGEGAELEIAAALDALAGRAGIDVVLLVRGGGSLEDLQAFNSEAVARAIARSPAPVVTGVGHEVDISIADLVADLRAPTPSAAAELALPDRATLFGLLARDFQRARRALSKRLDEATALLARERDALRVLAPSAQLLARRERLGAASRALARAAQARFERARAGLSGLAGRLESLSPLGVLTRGYAIVRRSRDGAIVRGAGDVAPGDRVSLRVAEAEIEAAVAAVHALRRA
ncbi:MAG TPA: exodeoxyribonuclease VII large subunit [Myxococcota bacterium]